MLRILRSLAINPLLSHFSKLSASSIILSSISFPMFTLPFLPASPSTGSQSSVNCAGPYYGTVLSSSRISSLKSSHVSKVGQRLPPMCKFLVANNVHELGFLVLKPEHVPWRGLELSFYGVYCECSEVLCIRDQCLSLLIWCHLRKIGSKIVLGIHGVPRNILGQDGPGQGYSGGLDGLVL